MIIQYCCSVPELYQDLLLLLLLQKYYLKSKSISPAGNQVLSGFNHEDVDTLLVLLHGSKVDSDVAVVCKDTDVFVLMISAYSKLNINNW